MHKYLSKCLEVYDHKLFSAYVNKLSRIAYENSLPLLTYSIST